MVTRILYIFGETLMNKSGSQITHITPIWGDPLAGLACLIPKLVGDKISWCTVLVDL